jgi:hypothetical protein
VVMPGNRVVEQQNLVEGWHRFTQSRCERRIRPAGTSRSR